MILYTEDEVQKIIAAHQRVCIELEELVVYWKNVAAQAIYRIPEGRMVITPAKLHNNAWEVDAVSYDSRNGQLVFELKNKEQIKIEKGERKNER